MNTISSSKPKLFSTLGQVCKLIPTHLVARLAGETGVEQKARTFTTWSHVVTLLYAQLSHALSLNDVCDGLSFVTGKLQAIRAAKAPRRNTFSHANRTRDPELARRLFWSTLEHLQKLAPGLGQRGQRRYGFRFKRLIHLVDSTTITLVANSLDWARHRRRKAAAKCHVRLDWGSLLPRFVVVACAGAGDDGTRTAELCAGVKPGEIVVFDKAYVVFCQLYALHARGLVWVTRAKEKMRCRVTQSRPVCGHILRDEIVALTLWKTHRDDPELLRRVVARVEVDGVEREMIFLTNQLDWAASSVADLYRCRWQVEVFFKQIKQTLQLADFLGHNENAVRLAGLDRAPALRPAALPGLGAPLGRKLFAALHSLARHPLDAHAPRRPAGTLWDSRPHQAPHARTPRERFPPRLPPPHGRLILWDSRQILKLTFTPMNTLSL
jgi:hypothetical protein